MSNVVHFSSIFELDTCISPFGLLFTLAHYIQEKNKKKMRKRKKKWKSNNVPVVLHVMSSLHVAIKAYVTLRMPV